MWIEECATGGGSNSTEVHVSQQMSDFVCVCDVRLFCRVIYLQVSMNKGLSYITSSVHITTTECVSPRAEICCSPLLPHLNQLFHSFSCALQSSHLSL